MYRRLNTATSSIKNRPKSVTVSKVVSSNGRSIITINGKSYNGNSIQVSGRRVIIDGKAVDDQVFTGGTLHIEVTGTLHSLQADGSVTCQNVTGDIDAGGSIKCGNVGGSVDAGGSVNCGSVTGDIDAGGSVRHS